MGYSLSPLRYPGGKSVLTSFLKHTLELNDAQDGCYVEPFCGGAGAAIGLLLGNDVKSIHLNDVDYSIYAFWWSILNETEKFISCIEAISVNVDEWNRQKQIFLDEDADIFDKGFATFFLNRCNHSGILLANPIGGITQTGKWKIDARFNKKNLISRIISIADRKDSIAVTNLDVFDFLNKIKDDKRKIFIYFDPPYIQGGPSLYLNYFSKETHICLSKTIKEISHKWIMTYDNCELFYIIYNYCNIAKFSINYSVQKKRKGLEILIFPRHIHIPHLSIDN